MITQEEVDIIIRSTRIINWVSIGVSFYVILTYALFKWRFPSSLALYFSVCSFCLPWFIQMGVVFVGLEELETSPTLCKIQGIGVQFFANTLVWWWFGISINIYIMVVKEVQEPDSFILYYHLLGWGMPTICTLIPLFLQKYGPVEDALWCWIDASDNHIWQFLFLYGAMGISAIVGVIIWMYVFYVAFRIYKGKEGKIVFLQPHMMRHVAFVLCYIIVFAILFSNRVHDIVTHSRVFGYLLATSVVTSGQGLICFCCFGLTKANFLAWMDLFSRAYHKITCTPYDSNAGYSPFWRFSNNGSDVNTDASSSEDTETDDFSAATYYNSSPQPHKRA